MRGGARQELEDRAEGFPLVGVVALARHAQERLEDLAQRFGLLRRRDRVAALAPGVVLREGERGELGRGFWMKGARVREDAGTFGLKAGFQLGARGGNARLA